VNYCLVMLIVHSATWACVWLDVRIEWEDVADTVAAAARWPSLQQRSCLPGRVLLTVGQGTVMPCCFAVERLQVQLFSGPFMYGSCSVLTSYASSVSQLLL